MIIMIGNPGSRPDQFIWLFMNNLGDPLFVIHHVREERLSLVMPLRVIEMEEVHTLGYFMEQGSFVVLWVYFAFILIYTFSFTYIFFGSYIYQPSGVCTSIGYKCFLLCSVGWLSFLGYGAWFWYCFLNYSIILLLS